ncbi:hypothetical protein F900_03529 [Acinetobacter modestus]|uniref:Uncharacterized protein n=1 Tax=Acinetobacter modestus TaxID=1776740 RepID=N9MXS6_9GAMM|nr:hypothetical protein F900_03529 [Acinetobacter modestus]
MLLYLVLSVFVTMFMDLSMRTALKKAMKLNEFLVSKEI